MEQVRLIDGACEWRQIDDEIVLLHVPQMRYVAVNRAGSRLWPSLQTGATVQQLADELVAAFGIDDHQARRDGERFVDWLCAEGLAERY